MDLVPNSDIYAVKAKARTELKLAQIVSSRKNVAIKGALQPRRDSEFKY
jgi:hypothetical protein